MKCPLPGFSLGPVRKCHPACVPGTGRVGADLGDRRWLKRGKFWKRGRWAGHGGGGGGPGGQGVGEGGEGGEGGGVGGLGRPGPASVGKELLLMLRRGFPNFPLSERAWASFIKPCSPQRSHKTSIRHIPSLSL